MSIKEYLDKWEYRYIKDLADHELVPWNDEQAFDMYPKHSRVYDKLKVAKKYTRLKTYDLEKTLPSNYPVMVKPRINLHGMSKGAYIASNIDEIGETRGMIAQQIATGKHHTTDLVMLEGDIVDWFTFECHKNHYGSFTLFESVKYVNERVCLNVKDMLKGYTGPVCVEYIGNNIIDIHLRPALQFYDISGGMQKQLPHFMKTGEWQMTTFEKTYSKVYRTFRNCKVSTPKRQKLPYGVTSIQYCWEKGSTLGEDIQDEFSYRYMVINGTSLKCIENVGHKIKNQLTFRWE